MDGGGIRGLILVVTLMELEKAVGKPIIQCFDWIAGTSTGGNAFFFMNFYMNFKNITVQFVTSEPMFCKQQLGSNLN